MRNEFLVCPACRNRIDVAQDLNDMGRRLLVAFGPPKCPMCRLTKMKREYYDVVQVR